MKIVAMLWLGIMSAVLIASPPQQPPAAEIQQQLKTADSTFTFRGKPINPRAVEDLTTWISDSRPGPVAVDVAGTFNSNRYFGDYSTDKDGPISATGVWERWRAASTCWKRGAAAAGPVSS